VVDHGCCWHWQQNRGDREGDMCMEAEGKGEPTFSLFYSVLYGKSSGGVANLLVEECGQNVGII